MNIIDELERQDRLADGAGIAAVVAKEDGREWLWDNRKSIIRMLRAGEKLKSYVEGECNMSIQKRSWVPDARIVLQEYQTAKESI